MRPAASGERTRSRGAPTIVVAVTLLSCCASSEAERRALVTTLRRAEAAERESERLFRDQALRSAPALDLRLLVGAVLARNPSVDAAREAWRGALARVPQARALDDPMVGYRVAPRTVPSLFDDGAEARFGHELMLSQRLPFPTKLALKGRSALFGAEAKQRDYEAARLDLALLAALLFYDLWLNERALAINAEHVVILGALKQAAEAEVAAGALSLVDSLEVDVELGIVEQERLALYAERAIVVARLNGLLHREPDAPLPPLAADVVPALAATTNAGDREAALERRAELLSLDARARAAEAEVELARAELLPDFGVDASYSSMWAMPEHRVMIGGSLNLPVQLERRSALIEEKEAALARARREIEARTDEVAVEIEAAQHEVAQASSTVALLEARVLPAARGRLDAARASLAAGRVTLFEVLRAERDLRDVALRAYRAAADLRRALVRLQRATGRMPGVDDHAAGAREEPP